MDVLTLDIALSRLVLQCFSVEYSKENISGELSKHSSYFFAQYHLPSVSTNVYSHPGSQRDVCLKWGKYNISSSPHVTVMKRKGGHVTPELSIRFESEFCFVLSCFVFKQKLLRDVGWGESLGIYISLEQALTND